MEGETWPAFCWALSSVDVVETSPVLITSIALFKSLVSASSRPSAKIPVRFVLFSNSGARDFSRAAIASAWISVRDSFIGVHLAQFASPIPMVR